MHDTFPDTPVYQGYNAPGRFEGEIRDLEVISGEVPRDIAGTFFRVGPDPAYPPRLGTDIHFNGDGMVTAFAFKNGHVDFKSRYAMTDKLKLERAAHQALFGAYRNPYTDDPSVAGRIRGTANTNVVCHHGRLLAFKEDSPPLAMDPLTLETHGYYWFDGRFSSDGAKFKSQTYTAHPKIDPKSGELFGFGYAAKGVATKDIAYYVVDKDGCVTHEAWFEAPYSAMVHDFVVTEHYVAFPITPITGSLERARHGESVFMWDGSLPVYVGVLPRYGQGAEVRWFKAPTRFEAHFMNGFDEGGKVYIDGPEARGNVFPFFPDVTDAPFDTNAALPYLTRWTLDMNTLGETFSAERLSDSVVEFPCVDPRFAMRKYRHGWLLAQDPTRPFIHQKMVFNSVAHVDLQTGKTRTYFAGPNEGPQEPFFIGNGPNAAEGEGYVGALFCNLEKQSTDLRLFDALNIDSGPVCVISLPVRLRPGLHGGWVHERDLPPPLS
jgi:carotenoid cleavage dioxygenase